jgi:sortase (surface protein transpeptidase)
MAISIDAAKHLSQQLNQLLSAKAESHAQVNQQNKADSKTEARSSNDTFDNETKQKSEQSGFRFPWSKKTH